MLVYKCEGCNELQKVDPRLEYLIQVGRRMICDCGHLNPITEDFSQYAKKSRVDAK